MTVKDTFLQHGRALEWLTSSVIFILAVVMALPGNTLSLSYALSTVTIYEPILILAFATVGISRILTLWINGNWRRSPWLRMVGAIIGGSAFAGMSAMLSMPYLLGTQPALPGSAGIYAVLAVFDLLAAHRSSADAHRAHRTP